MRVGTMLRDVIGALFKKPFTQKYPFERTEPPDRLRGKLVWDREKCTGCALCVKDCPSNAIEMVVNDKPNKRFVLRYNMDRCTYCAQCVQNCRFKCLDMSDEQWELAGLRKEPFTVYYGDEADVADFLEALEQSANQPCPDDLPEPLRVDEPPTVAAG
jgi:formate hydrogenlyase subunit 6/NADH:ubiquinone oxidoreductase subunit I